MSCIYNSRNLKYKSPFGAVEVDTKIRFTIELPLEFSYSQVYICFYDNDHFSKDIELSKDESTNNKIKYTCYFTPQNANILFYYFKIQNNSSITYIHKNANGTGYLSHNYGPDFQLTVFQKNLKTPDFVKGGIYYQIFPDRFFYSGEKKKNVPTDRVLRSDWGNMPYFLPNKQGKILNKDYFCGDLKGIQQKLPYLKSLGVNIIYLNPIFESHSNHRYNTADYMKIDPLLGTKEDFSNLCLAAKEKDIYIILDGVFNHTGDDSIYFNKKNRYSSVGAYNSQQSPYYSWYNFSEFPDNYDCWWNFSTLPTINKSNDEFIEFLCGDNGVIKKWLKLGASGFRLDVVDELPSHFVKKIRKAVKSEGEDKLLIGEVWEDASNKIAYGKAKKYFLGDQLDGVMNYPFRNAIISYIKNKDQNLFENSIMTIVENYPPEILNVCMNLLSTHDITRAITALAGSPEQNDRQWQFENVLSIYQYELGINMLKCAMALQYFLPGSPCIYYGDEVGVQGYRDPFNRKCYPWGSEDKNILEFSKFLGKLRKQLPVLANGSIEFIPSPKDIVSFKRHNKNYSTIFILNPNNYTKTVNLDLNLNIYKCIHGSHQNNNILLSPYSFAVFTNPI